MRPVLKLLWVLRVGLTLAASLQREPQACDSPPLMTGDFVVPTDDQDWAHGHYVYDALKQRVRVSATMTFMNQTITMDYLQLYSEGALYEIDVQASTCVKRPLEQDFEPLGVPPDATLLGSAVVGSTSGPGQGLRVNSWIIDSPLKVRSQLTVTDVGCVPVTSMVYTGSGWISLVFINTEEKADRSAFVPPPFCPKRGAKPEGKPVRSIRSILFHPGSPEL